MKLKGVPARANAPRVYTLVPATGLNRHLIAAARATDLKRQGVGATTKEPVKQRARRVE
jgi:hypothetical protein